MSEKNDIFDEHAIPEVQRMDALEARAEHPLSLDNPLVGTCLTNEDSDLFIFRTGVRSKNYGC
jgi:hypothetical protein